MANRTFRQFRYALEAMPVDIFAQAAIGAAGAPTINVANSKGVTSIARNAAGKYTITLQDKYVRLMGVAAMFTVAGVAAAPVINVFSSAVSSTGVLIIQLSDAAGVAADPASGEVMNLVLTLSNSTA